MLASRASIWPRDHFCRSTIVPRRSRPTTWNEFLPISMPTVATPAMDLLDMAVLLRLPARPSITLGRGRSTAGPLARIWALQSASSRSRVLRIALSCACSPRALSSCCMLLEISAAANAVRYSAGVSPKGWSPNMLRNNSPTAFLRSCVPYRISTFGVPCKFCLFAVSTEIGPSLPAILSVPCAKSQLLAMPPGRPNLLNETNRPNVHFCIAFDRGLVGFDCRRYPKRTAQTERPFRRVAPAGAIVHVLQLNSTRLYSHCRG